MSEKTPPYATFGFGSNPLQVQVGGDHYRTMAIQPVEFILANGLGFCEGNVVKYICRRKGDDRLQDLRKARHYLEILIANVEADQLKRADPIALPQAEEIVLTEPLRDEERSQDPQLVRIRWRDSLEQWEWFWLIGEKVDTAGRQFYLTRAPDPDTGKACGAFAFWACASEIEWMKRSRAVESADLDRRIQA